MTREEAIEIVCNIYQTDTEKEALAVLIPQLAESEDERIRRALIDGVRQIRCKNGVTQEQMLAYLEKQKEASKAIEAVERIDKYIDEQLANAHDMKDSNPEKKYYRGWDDALGKMAGILQDVYSDKKQKEQKPIECIEFDNEFENQVSHLLASVLNGEHEYNESFVKYAAQSLLGYAKNEMKPNEWDKREKLFTKALQTANAQIGQLFEENKKLKEQQPTEIDEYKIIKKHITEDSLSSEVNKRLKECGWYVTDTESLEWSEENEKDIAHIIRVLDDCYAYGKHDLSKTDHLEKEQKPAEKQDYSGLTDLERAIHRGFLSAGVENAPVTIIKETAQECLAQMKSAEWDELQSEFKNINKAFKDGKKEVVAHPERYGLCKPAEWSEEDRLHYANVLEALEYVKGCKSDYDKIEAVKSDIAWLKSLRNRVGKEFLQPHWKPSEEQIYSLGTVVKGAGENSVGSVAYNLKELYEQLKAIKEGKQ